MKSIHFKKSFACVLFIQFFIFSSCDKSTDTLSENRGESNISLAELFQDMDITQVSGHDKPIVFELTDLTGRKVGLSDLRGKIIFLNFWATWCSPCRTEMPSMERLHQRFKDGQFTMVAVNLQDPASKVRDFFKEYDLTFMALLDSEGDMMSRIGISSIPTTFILDKKGILIGGAVGAREWDSKKAIALFGRLMEM